MQQHFLHVPEACQHVVHRNTSHIRQACQHKTCELSCSVDTTQNSGQDLLIVLEIMWVCVQDIADEQAGGEDEALQRQQSAVQRATKVLLNRHAAPTGLVLTYLPWLISASPKHALLVLKVPPTQTYSRRSTPHVFTSVCL